MRDIQGRSFPRARILLADGHRATLLAVESFLKTDYDAVGAFKELQFWRTKDLVSPSPFLPQRFLIRPGLSRVPPGVARRHNASIRGRHYS